MTTAPTLKLSIGDITTWKVDAIVNAANTGLPAGGDVNGAIHKAAGPELLRYMQANPDSLGAGRAFLTPGFALKAKYIIHTAGPIWRGGAEDEAKRLAGCYHDSLKLAESKGILTIAFPSIGTGANGFPPEAATRIALQTITDFLESADRPMEVTLVFFTVHDYKMALKVEDKYFS